jgi:NADH-quinone oxidoreductase subunit C/D
VLAPGESVRRSSAVYAGADWQEREQFDLVGVRFAGHPDLRRLMMPETGQGTRCARTTPSTRACAVEMSVTMQSANRPGSRPIKRVDPHLVDRAYDPEADLMLLHFGPQHPSTHGVFRMDLYLDGEIIVKAVPYVGYLHRARREAVREAHLRAASRPSSTRTTTSRR